MRIQKICLRNPRHAKRFSSFKGKHKEIDDNPILGAGLGDDDYDDCQLAELHSELGMVQGQLCSIPYELYDLPDLKEILSLDTWNSCLIEEERFHLSAYLPDMDQQTFYLTMKEIFDGSDLYFGNPLDVFFKRLKGGFHPPKVAPLREGLHFLQRKKYYHSLRSYHDRTTQMFIDMKRLWDQCEVFSSVEERITIWKKKKKQRAMNLFDLNKFPKDDHQLSEEISLDTKGMKLVGSKRAKDMTSSSTANGMKFVVPNYRGKGVLKTKASGNGLFPNCNKKLVGSEISDRCRSAPKGVLRRMPKVTPVPREPSELMPRASQPTFLIRTQGLPDIKFSSLPYLHFPDAGGLYESPSLGQKVVGSGVLATLNQHQDTQIDQGSTTRTSYLSENSTRKLERQIFPSLDDISVLGKHKFSAGEVRRDTNEDYRPLINSTEARRYTFGSGILWPNLLKETTVTSSSVLLRNESNTGDNKTEKLLSKSSVLEGFKDEIVLPLMYKRRKAAAKVNLLGAGKTKLAGADLSSNQQFGEGAKAMKVKFTGWKDVPLNNES